MYALGEFGLSYGMKFGVSLQNHGRARRLWFVSIGQKCDRSQREKTRMEEKQERRIYQIPWSDGQRQCACLIPLITEADFRQPSAYH